MQMLDENKENGLQLLFGPSQIETAPAGWQLPNLNDFLVAKFGSDHATAIFYLDYGIRFALYRNSILEFAEATTVELNFLQLARIFNTTRELKIWRSDEGFSHRWRADDQEGKKWYAIEACQNLWGTRIEHQTDDQALPGGWTRLREDRGTDLIVPLPIVKEAELPAYIKTRNYIGETANGQATYVDCRFVALGKRGS